MRRVSIDRVRAPPFDLASDEDLDRTEPSLTVTKVTLEADPPVRYLKEGDSTLRRMVEVLIPEEGLYIGRTGHVATTPQEVDDRHGRLDLGDVVTYTHLSENSCSKIGLRRLARDRPQTIVSATTIFLGTGNAQKIIVTY